eukprot:s480_g2.t1
MDVSVKLLDLGMVPFGTTLASCCSITIYTCQEQMIYMWNVLTAIFCTQVLMVIGYCAALATFPDYWWTCTLCFGVPFSYIAIQNIYIDHDVMHGATFPVYEWQRFLTHPFADFFSLPWEEFVLEHNRHHASTVDLLIQGEFGWDPEEFHYALQQWAGPWSSNWYKYLLTVPFIPVIHFFGLNDTGSLFALEWWMHFPDEGAGGKCNKELPGSISEGWRFMFTVSVFARIGYSAAWMFITNFTHSLPWNEFLAQDPGRTWPVLHNVMAMVLGGKHRWNEMLFHDVHHAFPNAVGTLSQRGRFHGWEKVHDAAAEVLHRGLWKPNGDEARRVGRPVSETLAAATHSVVLGTTRQAPEVAAYEPKSGGILSVLEDMKSKARDNLNTLVSEDKKAQHSFAMLQQSLQMQIAADTKEMEQTKAVKAEASESKATAEGDLTGSEKDLANDKASLQKLEASCSQATADFEESKASRAEELEALKKAEEVLAEKTGNAQASVYKAMFLQVNEHSQTRSNSSQPDIRSFEVVKMVRTLAKKSQSSGLETLASNIESLLQTRQSEDVFAKVKELIQNMIDSRKEEAAADQTKKAYCDEEKAKTKDKVDKKSSESETLKSEAATLQRELAELAQLQIEMDETRKEESTAFKKQKEDRTAKREADMRRFIVMWSLVSAVVVRSSSSASTGILGMLEVVESDFGRSLAQAETAEATKAEDYESMTKQNKLTKVQKDQDQKYKTKAAAALDQAVGDLSSDGESTKDRGCKSRPIGSKGTHVPSSVLSPETVYLPHSLADSLHDPATVEEDASYICTLVQAEPPQESLAEAAMGGRGKGRAQWVARAPAEDWPTADDRTVSSSCMCANANVARFVTELNALSVEYSSAGFGDPGMLTAGKARRQLAFAETARRRWPNFGELWTEEVPQWSTPKVDLKCDFWQAGHKRYLEALHRYVRGLASDADVRAKMQLLSDLGFRLIESFVSEEEESDLMNYWSADGPVFALGTEEKRSKRRFFNYGPILPKETQGTTKSTLHVIPSVFGAMPSVVEKQRLQARIRESSPVAPEAEDDFDQMYVNFYDSSINSYIDYHHDHMSCMKGTVAGVSLGSACRLRLRPLEFRVADEALCIDLPSRSLFFLSGLSRWHLQHAIMDMRHDRLSLTFRTVDRSGSRSQIWNRSWAQLRGAEAANALWPLVTPEGWELHRLERWNWRSEEPESHSYYRVRRSKGSQNAVDGNSSKTANGMQGEAYAHNGAAEWPTPSRLEDLGHFFEGKSAGRQKGRGRSFYRPRQQQVQQLFECAETLHDAARRRGEKGPPISEWELSLAWGLREPGAISEAPLKPLSPECFHPAVPAKESLAKQCYDGGLSYEEKAAKPQEEIDGLKEALVSLGGTDLTAVLLQNKGLRGSVKH